MSSASLEVRAERETVWGDVCIGLAAYPAIVGGVIRGIRDKLTGEGSFEDGFNATVDNIVEAAKKFGENHAEQLTDGLIGAAAGGLVGCALGTKVSPGTGTVIGGLVGAPAGRYIGYCYGGRIRTEVKNWDVSRVSFGIKGWLPEPVFNVEFSRRSQ